jgi:hypothetical protein
MQRVDRHALDDCTTDYVTIGVAQANVFTGIFSTTIKESRAGFSLLTASGASSELGSCEQ